MLLLGIAKSQIRLEWNAEITHVAYLKPNYQVHLRTQKPLSELSENWATDFALGRMIEVSMLETNHCAGTVKTHAEIKIQDQRLVQSLEQAYNWLHVFAKFVALLGVIAYLAQLFKIYEHRRRAMAVFEFLILTTILFAIPLGILALVVGPFSLGDYFCLTTSSPETDVGEVFLKFTLSGLNWESMALPMSGLVFSVTAFGIMLSDFWKRHNKHSSGNLNSP